MTASASQGLRPSESYLEMDPVRPRFRANRHSFSSLMPVRSSKGSLRSIRENDENMAQPRTSRLATRRLSEMFSISTIIEAKKSSKHDSSKRSATTNNEQSQPREPLRESLELGRDIYLMNGPEDMIEVVSSDKQHILYKTSLPASFTSKHREKLSHVTISSGVASRSVAMISKPAGQLTLEIRGLQTIKFYRARPDCLLPVECFTLKQSSDFRRSFVRNDNITVTLPAGECDPTFSYAWKNTAMVGRGGLKLVDLRDSEVLAYYEPTLGKYIAKIHLQGSGLKLVKIVVATILALKSRPLLRDKDIQDHQSDAHILDSGLSTCLAEAPGYKDRSI